MKAKITLYCLRELHLPVLMPVYEAIKALGIEEVGFTAPIFSPGQGERAEEGLRPETLRMFEQRGIPFWGDPKDQKFASVITADACYDRVEGWGPVLCVGHGTISKNIYFIDGPSAYRENYASVLCVPGPWYTKSYGPNVITRIEATGFPKMDDFAADWDYRKLGVFARAGFELSKKTILFAPTYNPEFTGMEAFYAEWAKLDPSEYQIFFKLHGAAAESWRAKYRELARQNSNMFYVEDPSLIPYMFMSDLMVSDVSSAYVEYMVMNKPIVLFNNPRMKDTGLYNPDAVEFQVRGATHEIDHAHQLVPSILQNLSYDPKGPMRRNYCSQLFPDMDGKICQRVAKIAVDLLLGRLAPYPEYVQALNIYIPGQIHDLAKIKFNLSRLTLPYRIFSHHPLPDAFGEQFTLLGPNQEPEFPCAVLNGEFIFGNGWDWTISLARHFCPNTALAIPMLRESADNGIQQLTRLLNQKLEAPEQMLQAYSKYNLVHLSVPVQEGKIDGAVFGPAYASMSGFSSEVQSSTQKICPRLIQHAQIQQQKSAVFVGHYGY